MPNSEAQGVLVVTNDIDIDIVVDSKSWEPNAGVE
jgi:hypothetical protein